AGAARERDDPGEGAHAAAATFRGLGVLRQAHPSASRSIQPPAVTGDAHLRAGAEPDLAGQLRLAVVELLGVGGGAADPGRSAGVSGGSEVLRRGVPLVHVALAGNTDADLSGNRAGTR